MNATAAIWLTIIAVGVYHGLNPAMGWPLAVANGLTERRAGAVFATLLPLGGGHFAAMEQPALFTEEIRRCFAGMEL